MIKLSVCVLLLSLAGCGGVTNPLTYTQVDDPTWPANPDKWAGPGQNELATPPTKPAGTIPGGG